ncbi:MAG TPA: DUF6531 domain-containing protein, partial [Acidimicrobiales bacterium]|nr:DUF6531 domain-containing protein [Acidimicrobiales bacterium]
MHGSMGVLRRVVAVVGACAAVLLCIPTALMSAGSSASATTGASSYVWDLVHDVQAHPDQNPAPDSYGDQGTWAYQSGQPASSSSPGANQPLSYYTPVGCNDGTSNQIGEWQPADQAWAPLVEYIPCNGQSEVAAHPYPDADAVVAWTAPYTTTVNVSGSVTSIDPGGGDGVAWYLFTGTTQIGNGTVAAGGSASIAAVSNLTVAAGQVIYFHINAGPAGNTDYDTTSIDLTIIAMPPAAISSAPDTSNGWNLVNAFAEGGNANPFHVDGATSPWSIRRSTSLAHDGNYALLPTYAQPFDGLSGVRSWSAADASDCSSQTPPDSELPLVAANAGATDQQDIQGCLHDAPPNSVTVLPPSNGMAVIAWKSPISGTVDITGALTAAFSQDGLDWSIDEGTTTLASGTNSGPGATTSFGNVQANVAVGTYLYLLIDPGTQGNNLGDASQVDLTINPPGADLISGVAANTTVAETGAGAIPVAGPCSCWVGIPGAQYLWGDADGSATTYTFQTTFATPAGSTSGSILWSADNSSTVTLNGKSVGSNDTCEFTCVNTRPLTLAAAGGTNTLDIQVTNTDGPGMVIYQVQTGGQPAPAAELAGDTPTAANPNQQPAKSAAQSPDGVDQIFGNYTMDVTDLSIPGVGVPLRIERSYDSARPANGPLGYGWHLAFDLTLATGHNSISITRGDGRVDVYTLLKSGSYARPPGVEDQLVKNSDGTYTLTLESQIKYTFDAVGQLVKVVDPYGNTDVMTYNSNGQWVGMNDATGRNWSLNYVPNTNHIARVADAAGRTVAYSYDQAGNLTGVTDADGNTTHYAYDANHRMTSVTDARGNQTAQLSYDGLGRVAQVTNAAAGTSFYTYFPGRTIYQDADGNKWAYYFDAEYRLLGTIDPLGAASYIGYNSSGLLSTQTNADGDTTSYTYDSSGNNTSITDALGRTTTMTYTGHNLMSKTDPLGHTTTYSYDPSGQLVSVTDPLGHVTVQNTYLADGLLHRTTDALDNTTTYAYDQNGNRTSVTDPLGNVSTSSYDPAGRVTLVVDPLGRKLSYSYDALGHELTKTDNQSATTTYTYDQDGNQLTETAPAGNTTSSSYNAADLMTGQWDGNGTQTYAYAYDNMGHQTGIGYGDGTSAHRTYDPDGRLLATQSYLGQSRGYQTTYAYDPAGDQISETDPQGTTAPFHYATTHYSYDADHELLSVVDPLSTKAAVHYSYDLDGHRTAVTDLLGHVTQTAYDADGHPVTVTDALHNRTTMTYDAAGNLASRTNGVGQTVTYGYNYLGQMSEYAADGSTVEYNYDAAGERTAVIDNSGSTQYSYDIDGRLSKAVEPHGTVSYTYDTDGRLTGLTQPTATVAYTYENNNRIATVADKGAQVVAYGYDVMGRISSAAYANGDTSGYTYDYDGRLTDIAVHSQAGKLLATYSYTLDAAGDRVKEATPGSKSTNTYDSAGRLTKAAITTGGTTTSYSYSYDLAGNRTKQTVGATTTTYTYDADDQMTAAGTTPITYDRAGRLVSDGARSYTYNSLDQLTAVSGATTGSYVYDGNGQLLTQTESGTTTNYLVDSAGASPSRLASTSNGATTATVYGLDPVVEKSSKTTYDQTDGLADIALRTGPTGTIVQSSTFDPFGNPMAGASNSGVSGAPTMAGGALDYMHSRVYSPSLGRFLSRDDAAPNPGLALSFDPYTYALDQPTDLTDPSGLCSWADPLSCLSGAVNAVGGALSAAGQAVVSAGTAISTAAAAGVHAVGDTVASLAGQAKDAVANAGQYVLDASGSAAADAAKGIQSFFTASPVIGAGAGNVIGAGAGNVIGAGAGNVIGAGAG